MKKDKQEVKDVDTDITEKSWLLFRQSGLLFIVNQFLHIFGWCLVFEYIDNENLNESEPDRVFPARTKFRGFGEESQDRGYSKITKYMAENGEELLSEIIHE